MVKLGDKVQWTNRSGETYRATVAKVGKGRVDLHVWGMGAGSGPALVKDVIWETEPKAAPPVAPPKVRKRKDTKVVLPAAEQAEALVGKTEEPEG